jgi:hypothetical protein
MSAFERTDQKTPGPKIFLRVYSLQVEDVFRAVALKWLGNVFFFLHSRCLASIEGDRYERDSITSLYEYLFNIWKVGRNYSRFLPPNKLEP